MPDGTQKMEGRWERQLADVELKTVWMTRPDEIVEWAWANQTYFRYDRACAIIRTGAMGGDIRDIHGGWKYNNGLVLLFDWREIVHMGKIKFIQR